MVPTKTKIVKKREEIIVVNLLTIVKQKSQSDTSPFSPRPYHNLLLLWGGGKKHYQTVSFLLFPLYPLLKNPTPHLLPNQTTWSMRAIQ